MKHINKLVVLFLALLAFTACDKDEELLTINEKDIKSEISVSTDNLVLEKAVEIADALTITMMKPTFKVDVTPNYKVIMKVGENEKRISLVGGELAKVFSSVELNKTLLDFGIEPETETVVEFTGLIELGSKKILSEKKTVNVTPYAMKLDLTTTWGVVGDATPNGWNGPDMPFYKSTVNPSEFVAYVTLTDGEIKFRENNDWSNNYGDDGADGTLEPGGANIAVSAGTYKITLNLSALTYKIETFSWGVVGDAAPNGWNGPDVAFEYVPTTDTWKALVKLAAGEIKFRQNNDWANNLGDDGADGTLEPGGANIAVEAGNYLIELNLNDNTYVMTKVENVWGVVGSATPNEWNGPDVKLAMDFTKEGVWYANNVTLKDGEIKFRANESWDNNYGSNDADGNLQAGGANIAVVEGVYDIVLDLSNPDAPTYTLTKK